MDTEVIRSQLDRLTQLASQHRADAGLTPEADAPLAASLPLLGDALRQIAFELRELGADERWIESLHAVGNALWCWHFFLSHRERWMPGNPARVDSYGARGFVRQWLERPWGILGIDDMQIALGGSPGGDPPEMFGALRPLLRAGVDAFIAEALPGESHVEARLERLIGQRCLLSDARRAVRWIEYAEQERIALAELIVDLLTHWFYGRSLPERRAVLDAQLEPLRQRLTKADWLDDLARDPDLPGLSRRQTRWLEQYRRDPEGTIRELFEFEEDSAVADRADVYPPERFVIMTDESWAAAGE